MKMKAVGSFKTSGSDYTVTRSHILEEQNPLVYSSIFFYNFRSSNC
jgi:hypothetical protein